MHPNLSPHLHPTCEEVIRALEECHAAHPLQKFVGKCNGLKAALDRCLAEEYLVRRELNHAQSMEEKRRLRARLDELGALDNVRAAGE